MHRRFLKIAQQFSHDVAAKRSPRVIVNMPPRHGKSSMGDRLAAWHLGRHPDHELILAGYALRPAQKRNKAIRSVVMTQTQTYAFPDFALASEAVSEWETTKGGGSMAAGVDGSITGMGAHALIIDDPVKGWAESLSPTIREKCWDWYTGDAYTRLAPGGGVMVIQTRWHEDDLTGRLLEQSAKLKALGEPHDDWQVFSFSAVALDDEHDPETGALIREKGASLHPARYPLSRLKLIRATQGPVKWRALYQQQPSTPGGSVWRREWIRHWTHGEPTEAQKARGVVQLPKRFDRVIDSWDLTFGSQSKTASFVVGYKLGLAGDRIFVLRERRGRWDFVRTKQEILALAAASAHAQCDQRPDAVLVEDKANGPAVRDELQDALPIIKMVTPDGSKLARAHAAAPAFEQGHVYVIEGDWGPAAVAEWVGFPDGKHDDRVDALSQGIRELRRPVQSFFMFKLG